MHVQALWTYLPRRLRARVLRAEEMRMGSPLYGQLTLDGDVIGGSYEAGSLLWSVEGVVSLPRNVGDQELRISLDGAEAVVRVRVGECHQAGAGRSRSGGCCSRFPGAMAGRRSVRAPRDPGVESNRADLARHADTPVAVRTGTAARARCLPACTARPGRPTLPAPAFANVPDARDQAVGGLTRRAARRPRPVLPDQSR
jgi:hypothetical protein